MIEAVLLDVGGVFTLPTQEEIRGVLEAAGCRLDATAIDRCHYAGMAAMDRAQAEEWRAYMEAYARAAGVPDDECADIGQQVWEAFRHGNGWRRRVETSCEALRQIAARGVKMAIVSNSDGTAEAVLRELAVCHVGPGPGVTVHAIFDSHVVGVSKPDPGIFHLALQALEVKPDQAVHVGDSRRFDVCGARAAGVRPCHLDPYGFCQDADHAHMRELGELLSWLG
ncbi:MAG: HAD family hydrolase [Candidatus Xenobia bacterium]